MRESVLAAVGLAAALAASAPEAAAGGAREALLATRRDGGIADRTGIAEEARSSGLPTDAVVPPEVGSSDPPGLAARIDAAPRAGVPPGTPPAARERAVVETAIRDSIGWALTKDRARLESVLSHGDDLFIFHPDSKSTVRGWAPFAKLLDQFMDPRFVATRFEVRDLAVRFSRGRDVAWFSASLDDCGSWEGRESCWKDARWTGVLEQREGVWVIVQMHFSFAKD